MTRMLAITDNGRKALRALNYRTIGVIKHELTDYEKRTYYM